MNQHNRRVETVARPQINHIQARAIDRDRFTALGITSLQEPDAGLREQRQSD
jgi:hypothetical protein